MATLLEGAPQFVTQPEAKVLAAGDSPLLLTVRALGKHTISYTWTLDGKAVTKTGKAVSYALNERGECVLKIEEFSSKTTGKYACAAENAVGKASLSVLVEIADKSKMTAPSPPTFLEPLTDLHLTKEGDPATLAAKVAGNPLPTVHWERVALATESWGSLASGQSGWLCAQSGADCRASKKGVHAADQAYYYCVATNAHGKATSSALLTVADAGGRQPPHFVKSLRNTWASEGDSVVLECQYSGAPSPDITWYKNELFVVESHNVEIEFSASNTCRLIIRNMGTAQLGTYMCQAANEHGTVTTAAKVTLGRHRTGRPVQFMEKQMGVMVRETQQVVEIEERAKLERVKREYVGKTKPPKKTGIAPAFTRGLHDLELHEGEQVTVEGVEKTKVYKRQRRVVGPAKEHVSESSTERAATTKTIEEIRAMISQRNTKTCPPKFLVKPRPRKAIDEYKSLRLKAAISANPVPAVTWDKNGMLLETGNKYSIYNDGDFYYLEVHHVSESDHGFYNCIAANAHGMAVVSCQVEVQPLSDGAAMSAHHQKHARKEHKVPQFIEVLPGKMETALNEPVTIECSVEGYPAPAIDWLHERAPLVPTAAIQTAYDGECATLKVAHVTTEMAGRYTCIATNASGSARTSMLMTVRGGDGGGRQKGSRSPSARVRAERAPKFRDSSMEPVGASDGDRLVLSAQLVQGVEPVEIAWLHDNCEVTDSKGFHYEREGGAHRLVIADAFPEDSGVYECRATNQYGTAVCGGTVTITEKRKTYEEPSILEAASKVHWALGGSGEIAIKLAGHPEPRVTWLRGGDDLRSAADAADRCTVWNVGNMFYLCLGNLDAHDAGEYTLVAENSAGACSHTFAVVCESKPLASSSAPAPSPPQFVERPSSAVYIRPDEALVLNAYYTGTPKPAVKWFKAGLELTDTGSLTRICAPPPAHSGAAGTQLHIGSAQEVDAGEYLLTLTNDHGTAMATTHVHVGKSGGKGMDSPMASPRGKK